MYFAFFLLRCPRRWTVIFEVSDSSLAPLFNVVNETSVPKLNGSVKLLHNENVLIFKIKSTF